MTGVRTLTTHQSRTSRRNHGELSRAPSRPLASHDGQLPHCDRRVRELVRAGPRASGRDRRPRAGHGRAVPERTQGDRLRADGALGLGRIQIGGAVPRRAADPSRPGSIDAPARTHAEGEGREPPRTHRRRDVASHRTLRRGRERQTRQRHRLDAPGLRSPQGGARRTSPRRRRSHRTASAHQSRDDQIGPRTRRQPPHRDAQSARLVHRRPPQGR